MTRAKLFKKIFTILILAIILASPFVLLPVFSAQAQSFGDPCATSNDCGSGLICNQDNPGDGYCAECSSNNACSNSADVCQTDTCLAGSGGSTSGGTKQFGETCSTASECASPYVCNTNNVCGYASNGGSTGTGSTASDSNGIGAQSPSGPFDLFGIVDGNDLGSFIASLYRSAIRLVGIIVFFQFLRAGLMYMSGNTGQVSGIMKDAVIGTFILFAAWIILNSINPDLVGGSFTLGATGSGGATSNPPSDPGPTKKANGVACSASPECQSSYCDSSKKCATAPGNPPGGTGQCQVITNDGNPCSVNNLKGTCFGDHAEQASAICNAESGGNTLLFSGADICNKGTANAIKVSWGLFQVNLTGHSVGGLNCPAAVGPLYTSKNHVCSIKDQTTYDQCVAAAQDSDKNIQVACSISKNGLHWGQWGANSKCGFPK